MEPCAAVNGTPMARKTCDGSSEPEVQAEPDEAQMPYSFQHQQDRFALDILEGDAGGVRQPVFSISVDKGMRNFFKQHGFQLVPQLLHPHHVLCKMVPRQFAGFAETNDRGHVFGAAPASVFLVTADEEW